MHTAPTVTPEARHLPRIPIRRIGWEAFGISSFCDNLLLSVFSLQKFILCKAPRKSLLQNSILSPASHLRGRATSKLRLEMVGVYPISGEKATSKPRSEMEGFVIGI